jgi:hypothetical protein
MGKEKLNSAWSSLNVMPTSLACEMAFKKTGSLLFFTIRHLFERFRQLAVERGGKGFLRVARLFRVRGGSRGIGGIGRFGGGDTKGDDEFPGCELAAICLTWRGRRYLVLRESKGPACNDYREYGDPWTTGADTLACADSDRISAVRFGSCGGGLASPGERAWSGLGSDAAVAMPHPVSRTGPPFEPQVRLRYVLRVNRAGIFL